MTCANQKCKKPITKQAYCDSCEKPLCGRCFVSDREGDGSTILCPHCKVRQPVPTFD